MNKKIWTLLLIVALIGSLNTWAQESTATKYTPKELFGFHASEMCIRDSCAGLLREDARDGRPPL